MSVNANFVTVYTNNSGVETFSPYQQLDQIEIGVGQRQYPSTPASRNTTKSKMMDVDETCYERNVNKTSYPDALLRNVNYGKVPVILHNNKISKASKPHVFLIILMRLCE